MGCDDAYRPIGYREGGVGGGVWDFEKFYGAAGAEKFFELQAKTRFSSWKTCPKAVRNAQEAS